MIRHPHLLNANTARAYPLADAATAVALDGTPLPPDILADALLAYPWHAGEQLYLAAVQVTAQLATLAIHGYDPLTRQHTALAVLTVPQPVMPYRMYPVHPLLDGVAGWLSFGPGVANPYNGRFDLDSGLLLPRVGRPTAAPPVTALGAVTPGLQGDVWLRAEEPLQLVKGTRIIDGQAQTVAVLELVGTPQLDTLLSYAGACGARPASRDCGDPAPIEYLNTVAPDTSGNITLRLYGCAILGRVEDAHGVVVECAASMAATCPASTLPGPTGKLRNDYTDQCPGSLELPPPVEDLTPLSDSSHSACNSESVGPYAGLPFADTSMLSLDDWTVVRGLWQPQSGRGLSTVGSEAASNLLAFTRFTDIAVGRIYATELVMRTGASPLAGLVLNYRRHSLYPARRVYTVVALDYTMKRLRILQFNGTVLTDTGIWAGIPWLALGQSCTLVVAVEAGGTDMVTIAAAVSVIGSPAFTASIAATPLRNYTPATGTCGFYAERTGAEFYSLSITES